jgi:UDP-N-acetylglucosamine--N-acetylmuramyl-(pentapeptide) pyrophosphoryl-undecaprenol N-acetylglucosamine transferase
MKILKPNKTLRILFTGGGSGGHVYPLVSVLKEMQKFIPDFEKQGLDMEYYYIGSNDFTLDLIKHENIQVFPLNIKKADKNLFKKIINIFINFGTLIRAYFKVLFLMPDAIFAKGGFASSFVLIVGIVFRIPIFIHESDSIPGYTNQLFSKFAQIVFISFEDSRKYLKNKNIELVGNPIDDNLLVVANTEESLDMLKEKIGLNSKFKTLLILGGSQGAQTINNLILDMLPEALQKYEIIHQVGVNNQEDIKREVSVIFRETIKDSECEKRYHLISILNHKNVLSFESLGYSMACSDLIISRAGSGSIFEIAAFKKPSIMIPLP